MSLNFLYHSTRIDLDAVSLFFVICFSAADFTNILLNHDSPDQQCNSATPHPDSFWESCQIHYIVVGLFLKSSSWLYFNVMCITDHNILLQIDGFVDPAIRALEVSAVSDIWAAGCRLLTCLAKQ